nr:zinc finger, CCHC-type [Tanacetum cinerariifolium]
MEYMMKNVFGLRWNCRELKGIVKLRFFRNMRFNESGKYKKTFIASGVGTSSMQVLHGFEFEVEPLGDHTFKVEPRENIDQGSGLQEVKTQDLIDYQLARDREQHLSCKLFRYIEDSNEAAFAAVKKIYAHESLTFNNTVACEVISKWKVGLKDDMDARSDVFYNGKLVQTLLEGHSILSLEGSLSKDFDVERMVVKKKIWPKGLLTESRYELMLVAGIATGALVKGGSRSEVPAQVEVAAY